MATGLFGTLANMAKMGSKVPKTSGIGGAAAGVSRVTPKYPLMNPAQRMSSYGQQSLGAQMRQGADVKPRMFGGPTQKLQEPKATTNILGETKPAPYINPGIKPAGPSTLGNVGRMAGSAMSKLSLPLTAGFAAYGATGAVQNDPGDWQSKTYSGAKGAMQAIDPTTILPDSVAGGGLVSLLPSSGAERVGQGQAPQPLADVDMYEDIGYGQQERGFFPDPSSSTGWSYSNGRGMIAKGVDIPELHNRVLTQTGKRSYGAAPSEMTSMDLAQAPDLRQAGPFGY